MNATHWDSTPENFDRYDCFLKPIYIEDVRHFPTPDSPIIGYRITPSTVRCAEGYYGLVGEIPERICGGACGETVEWGGESPDLLKTIARTNDRVQLLRSRYPQLHPRPALTL